MTRPERDIIYARWRGKREAVIAKEQELMAARLAVQTRMDELAVLRQQEEADLLLLSERATVLRPRGTRE